MNRTRIFTAVILLCSASSILASPRADLSSASQETRDAAAKVLLKSYSPPSRTNWNSLIDAITAGTQKTNVLGTIRQFNPDFQPEGGAAAGATCVEAYRLDDLWVLECIFLCSSNTLLERRLAERLRNIWVEPPPGFTGIWTTYFANGRRSHEIHYKHGKYDGEFTSFRPDGSKCVVQHYIAQSCEGEDTGYFPSGRVMYKGVYRGGKQVGAWAWFNEDGTVKSTMDCDKRK